MVVKGTIKEPPDKDDAWFYEMSKKTNIIYDVGANIGYTAVLTYIANPDCKLVLIDPNPEALSIAAKNAIFNKFSQNCVFLNAFSSAKDNEEVIFYTVGAGAAGSKYKNHAKTAAKLNSNFKVKTVTLDSICKLTSLKPDLVKIDVEGAEVDVLNGAKSLAMKIKPTFFVEMHSNPTLSMSKNASEVLKWCKSLNYNAYYLKDKSILEDPLSIAHRGRCHLLLLPADKSFPESLKFIEQGSEIKF